jgi:predicted GIY-YIG superfamily endonuclease
MSTLNTSSFLNEPGVYAIRCKINNKNYIGQSQNLKGRFQSHFLSFKKGETNKSLFSDIKLYGLDNFELIIVQHGIEAESRNKRLELESKIQAELLMLGLCYNTGYNETHAHGPSGEFTSEPGLYCIYNKVRDISYFGETGQAGGIRQRFANWKDRLRKNTATNQKLSSDWQEDGEEAFDFIPLLHGAKWSDESIRKEAETELIFNTLNEGKKVYNFTGPEQLRLSCALAAKSTILHNQSPEYKEFISKLNKGRTNVTGRKPIVADGNVYLSITEAKESYELGKTETIRLRIEKGMFRYATKEEIQMEELRRANGGEPIKVPNLTVKRTGKAKAVILSLPNRNIKEQYYESVSAAASEIGVSAAYISKLVKNGTYGCHFVYE